MILMSSRVENLRQTWAGLQKTGIALMGWDGTQFFPGGRIDDVGVYVIIPKLALLFNLPLDQTIHLFFTGLLLGSGLISAWGFFPSFQALDLARLGSI